MALAQPTALPLTLPEADPSFPSADPNRAENASDPRERSRLAREVADTHKRGLEARARTDLTREKYLIHIDGEGDGQWADIVYGSQVGVPLNISGGLRLQYNLLRPLVDNWVAYHTAQEFQVVANPRPSAKSRDQSRIDTIWANDLIRRQSMNSVLSEALFFAAAFGSCPVHVAWRDDMSLDLYEPFYDPRPPEESKMALRPGRIDIWPGDPWATAYNPGAKRGSFHWVTCDRVLPAQIVRDTFAHLPGIENVTGRDGAVSASRFQRVMNRWGMSQGAHGTAAVTSSMNGEELVATVWREVLPGYDSRYPKGRLQVVALVGTDDAGPGASNVGGEAFLLHDGVLPGGMSSVVPVMGGFRGDDVLGKPYVADLDDLQVILNQYVTLEAEFLRRFARPPLIITAGGLVDDTVTTEDDAILETTEPQFRPEFLYPPAQGANVYDRAIERTMDQMFRLGGWQAASRGESKSGDPAAKVVALMEADDTVFAPVNRALRQSVVRVLQTGHRLAKRYMTLPYMLQHVVGEDLAYLAEPYIKASDLSDDPPEYTVVSGYGATPEAKTKQLMGYVTTKGSDGRPLMDTEEFWRLNPDQSIRPPEITAKHQVEARALWIIKAITQVAADLREQFGPQADQFAEQAHQILMRDFPPRRDDPPQLHVRTLSQVTQDESADPIARQLATARQSIYFDILAGQAAQQAGPPQKPGEPQSQPQPQRRPSRPGAGQAVARPQPQGNPNIRDLASEVNSLTAMAEAPREA